MRFASRPTSRNLAIGRRPVVAGVLAAFALVVVIVTALVLTAINQVSENANRLDDERSRETTSGALLTFRDQLGATLNDYAAWDDAAQYVYSDDGMDWIISNFGDMTVNSELFDTVVLLDAKSRPVIFYQDGGPLFNDVDEYFGPGLRQLTRIAMDPENVDMPEARGFLQTTRGIAAVGVALVREKSGLVEYPPEERQYLIFARHLEDRTVSRLASIYVIDGLKLVGADQKSDYFVDVTDPLGRIIGKLIWSSRSPGDISFREVRGYVVAAVSIAGLAFLSLFLIGTKALDKLKADEAVARELAIRDRLSGLYNRAGLFERLDLLALRARAESLDLLLLYLDLDGFKEVNDSFGHGTGDRLIRGVAAGLRVLVPEDAVLARIGGDEFAVALLSKDADGTGSVLSNAVISLFREPFIIGDKVATIGCSIGMAISTEGATGGEELLRRADMAMYQAKERGKNRRVSWDPEMDVQREDRTRLEYDLRHAIDAGDIRVVFQPVIHAVSRKIIGVEALARWERAGHGPISPDVFIPVAETSGLIDALGLLVLRRACEEARHWPDIKLAVNVSPVQFRNPAFSGQIADVLHDTGMPARRVTLEMTEGYFIQHPERAIAVMEKLRQLGVGIALDDFGAGFASVGYLRRFGFDRMKIDRTLVSALDQGGKALDMLEATVALARSLDMPVTAEGVETEDQAAVLRDCGCDELQGYLFSKPRDAKEILPLLGRRFAPAMPERVLAC